MSEVNDVWIKCTTSNGPPEGFRYDIRYADVVHVQSGNVSRGMMWSDWAVYDGYWRPSADDGWQLNDERKLTGQVDAVLRYGGVILDCDAVDLGWNVLDGDRSILWWRPAASTVTEEPETKESDMSEVKESWIKCTADNEPPEGFGYVLSASDDVDRHTLDIPWADRARRGDFWRPAKCDGWILNDGTNRTGQVEYVCRNGVVSSEGRQAEGLRWALDDYTWTIIWWRPAKAVAAEEPQEPEVEPEHDGWIPCTADNEPPEGFRFDVLYRVGDVTLHGGLCLGVKWEARCERGDRWRPAQCDGWKLNDGTKQAGQVDVVFRYGGMILDYDAADLSWLVLRDDTHSILWWRPAAPTEAEEPELSLLGKLISATDDRKRATDRWRVANEAIRDNMGERDRVIMRHDGDLYLVEWDDAETVSWVQIDEI